MSEDRSSTGSHRQPDGGSSALKMLGVGGAVLALVGVSSVGALAFGVAQGDMGHKARPTMTVTVTSSEDGQGGSGTSTTSPSASGSPSPSSSPSSVPSNDPSLNSVADANGCVTLWTVSPGDTLSNISGSTGVSVGRLQDVNHIKDVNLIYDEEVLCVPEQ